MLGLASVQTSEPTQLESNERAIAAATVTSNPWAVYGFRVDGRTIVDWYLTDRGKRLTTDERGWLLAQQQSWLTIWEVLAVDPGKQVIVKDLLTGEQRTVDEVSGSKTLTKRDVVLARVVDHNGLSVFCGSHPRPLPPFEAAEVVRQARSRLRKKTAIPVDRLRDDKIGRYLIECWEDAVFDLDEARSTPPKLQNTDGDELLLTIDHFAFDTANRRAVEECLAAMDSVHPPEEGDREPSFTFLRAGNKIHKSWEATTIGRAVLSDRGLKLETNSVQRADHLRKRLETTCATLLRHRVREHSDPLALMSEKEPGAPRSMPVKSPAGRRSTCYSKTWRITRVVCRAASSSTFLPSERL